MTGEMGKAPDSTAKDLSFTKFEQIATGRSHSLFLDAEGKVWSCGWNTYGQLGICVPIEKKFVPCRIGSVPLIVAISTKVDHSLLLDNSGNVWAFGRNSEMQCGLGHQRDSFSPTKILNVPQIQSISAGMDHSLLLDVDGSVWKCGCGHWEPMKVIASRKIIQIAAGMTRSLLLDVEGTICTINSANSVEYAKQALPVITFIACGHNLFCLDVEGNIWLDGDLGSIADLDANKGQAFKKVENMPKMCSISCGIGFVHFVDVEGHVWGCGTNEFSQLGFESLESQILEPTLISEARLFTKCVTKSARSQY